MTRSLPLAASRLLAVLACASLVLHAGFAQTKAKAPKPDLHAGGVSPSSIPNHETTEVTLPGYHLTGAKIVTGSICAVVSYQVVSDNQIKMQIKGARTLDDKDSQCTLEVRTPGGSASTWIVVEFTGDEQKQLQDRERAEENAKGLAFIQRSGKAWHLTFAGGADVTYTSAGVDDGGMPIFHNAAGAEVKIAVSNDNTVLILEEGCIRSGKLAGSKVANGQSRGSCSPSGAWTGVVSQ